MSDNVDERVLDAVLNDLLRTLDVGRVTLRLRHMGGYFGVSNEAAAVGVRRLKGTNEPITLARQPVVRTLEDTHTAVVQNDCRTALDDPDFHRMLDAYGVTAQMVAPVMDGDRFIAIVSVHETRGPRLWREEEVAQLTETCSHIAGFLHNGSGKSATGEEVEQYE